MFNIYLLFIYYLLIFVLFYLSGVPAKQASTNITISVHTEDTILPVFSNTVPYTTVSESLSVGGDVLTVVVTGNNIKYEIVGGNDGNVFRISSAGQITLRSKLDYELKQSYDILVRAIEPSMPKRYAIFRYIVKVLDVNDNAPIFAVEDPSLPVKVFIDQFSPAGTVISKVILTTE